MTSIDKNKKRKKEEEEDDEDEEYDIMNDSVTSAGLNDKSMTDDDTASTSTTITTHNNSNMKNRNNSNKSIYSNSNKSRKSKRSTSATSKQLNINNSDDEEGDDDDEDDPNTNTNDETFEDDEDEPDEDDEDFEDDDDNNNNNSKSNVKISKTKRQSSIIPPTQAEVDELVNKSIDESDNDSDDDSDEETNNNNKQQQTVTETTSSSLPPPPPPSQNKSKQTTTTTVTTTSTSNSTITTSPTTTKNVQTTSPTTPSKQTRNKNSPMFNNTVEETVNEGLYHCDYCQKDISGVVRIRCSVCSDFDLCLECFSVGVEITPHRNFHDYHIVDNMHFPMFTEEWGADEELLLLEAIELYGLGNWNEVSENVGSHSKSPSECKAHYFQYYLNSATSPLPDTSKVLTTSENVHFKRAKATINDKSKKLNNRSSSSEEGPSGPIVDSVGYMKNRKHFEHEHDNEAELMVKDLTFEADDFPADREVKLAILESYDQRLDERVRRRNFIVDSGLLEYRKLERKRYKEDKEILSNLKCFIQTLPKEDHEALINGCINERNIKSRILQLQEYRENGIKTVADGLNFDEDKRKREIDKSTMKQRSKSDMFGSGFGNSYGVSFASTFNHQYLGNGGTVSSIATSSSAGGDKTFTFKTQKQITKDKEDTFMGVNGGIKPHHSSKIKKNPKIELEGLPNSDALSVKEKQICTNLRLLPQQYLIVKEAIIAESIKSPEFIIKQSTALKLIKLNALKVLKILEFFENCGWVKVKADHQNNSNLLNNNNNIK